MAHCCCPNSRAGVPPAPTATTSPTDRCWLGGPRQEAEADYAKYGDASELHVIIFDEIDAICKVCPREEAWVVFHWFFSVFVGHESGGGGREEGRRGRGKGRAETAHGSGALHDHHCVHWHCCCCCLGSSYAHTHRALRALPAPTALVPACARCPRTCLCPQHAPTHPCLQSRGSVRDGSGVHDTIVNQLLTKIDGVDALNNILLIGMTNRCVCGVVVKRGVGVWIQGMTRRLEREDWQCGWVYARGGTRSSSQQLLFRCNTSAHPPPPGPPIPTHPRACAPAPPAAQPTLSLPL